MHRFLLYAHLRITKHHLESFECLPPVRRFRTCRFASPLITMCPRFFRNACTLFLPHGFYYKSGKDIAITYIAMRYISQKRP
jgi:hypothetical protein